QAFDDYRGPRSFPTRRSSDLDEMIDLMGGQAAGISVKGNPGVVLIAGLQGSGKTTFSAKLANFLKSKRKHKPLLVACDVYRPARSEEHTSELQSREKLVCRLL